MYDLMKKVYDDLKKAMEEKQAVLEEMTAAYNDGTDEGKNKALALREKLDEKQKAVDELNSTYLSLLKAEKPGGDEIQDLIPAPGAEASGEGKNEKSMTREAYDSLDAGEKMKFVKSGGKITE